MTLIELLVSIAIASLLAGVTVFMLYSTMNAYFFGQNDVVLQQKISDVMEDISSGKFETYGIKDSLKIVSAGEHSISFVPPWVEGPYDIRADRTYTLELPIEPGSPIPIAEVKKDNEKEYLPTSIIFTYGERKGSITPDDKILLQEFLPTGTKLRIVYKPDSSYREAIETFRWEDKEKKLYRDYRGTTDRVPKHLTDTVELNKVTFSYFDNTNSKIDPQPNGFVSEEFLPLITAVMIDISGSIYAKDKKEILKKDLINFCSMRNTTSVGTGIVIRRDSHFFIPNSRKIKAFTLYNIMGLKDRGTIVLEARPEEGNIYRVTITLANDKDGKAKIISYKAEYPPGTVIISETLNRDIDLGFNLFSLGNDGRFDYDYDIDKRNVVDLQGKVELFVTEMEGVDGAALFIKP